MQICLCGAESGHPHEPTCPYPLYGASAAQEDAWLRARQEMRRRLLAEFQKRPDRGRFPADDGREIARAAEFRRVWHTLEVFGACGAWGGPQCANVWWEYLAAGMPADVSEFVGRRANVLSHGSEPRTA